MAEISSDDERRARVKESALATYIKASELARDLSPTDPLSLGLALNFSVFYYDIMKKPVVARDMAKKAFETAIVESDELMIGETIRDFFFIIQLMRDNITMWSKERKWYIENEYVRPLPIKINYKLSKIKHSFTVLTSIDNLFTETGGPPLELQREKSNSHIGPRSVNITYRHCRYPSIHSQIFNNIYNIIHTKTPPIVPERNYKSMQSKANHCNRPEQYIQLLR